MATRSKKQNKEQFDGFEEDVARSLRLSQSALKVGEDFYQSNARRRKRYERLSQQIDGFLERIKQDASITHG